MVSNLPMEKALLVEDDPLIQEILVEYLHNNKFKVDTVGSGEAALDMMNGNKYSFMITDIGLPGMNGFDLIREAKKLNPLMPVAITTADVSDIDHSLLKLIDNLVLEKPFHSSDFTGLLTKLRNKIQSKV
ncbi:MAG: response regulator [Pseudomonadota bacterium]|nr:response regulator [Pseudomonadota bacterium]